VGDKELAKFFGLGDPIVIQISYVVLFEILGGIVIKIIDLFERTDVLLRIAVTVETPTHRVTLGLIDLFHLVHVSVAALTGNSPVQVCGMVEVDVIRGLVHPNPLDRLTLNSIAIGILKRSVVFVDRHGSTKSG
jgi:hypothetical protein